MSVPDQEQQTAMYDQPIAGEEGWWDEIRAVGAKHGFEFGNITLRETVVDGDQVEIEAKRSLGYDISNGGATPFARRVIDILQQARDVYRDRNAQYKDNFRMVGDVMVALFPEGRPGLKTAEDYNRWHIFELIIVKLTRYANNYDNPHEDSLLDELPYLAILGAQDQELRERLAEESTGKSRDWMDRFKSPIPPVTLRHSADQQERE